MFSSITDKISHLVRCGRIRDVMKGSRTTKPSVPTVQISRWLEEPGYEGHVITYPSPVFISAFHNRSNIGHERRSSAFAMQSGGADLRQGILEADGTLEADGDITHGEAVTANDLRPAPHEDLTNKHNLHSPGPALPPLALGSNLGRTMKYSPGLCEARVVAPVAEEHRPEGNINAGQAGVETGHDAGDQVELEGGAVDVGSGMGEPGGFHRVLTTPDFSPVVVPPNQHMRLPLSFDGQPTFGQLISMAFQEESGSSSSDSGLGGSASVTDAGDSGAEGTNGPDSGEHSPTELVHRENSVAPKCPDSDGMVGAPQVADEESSRMKVEVKNYHYRRDRNRERYQDSYFYGSLEVIMEEDLEGELEEYHWECAVGGF